MWATLSGVAFRVLGFRLLSPLPVTVDARSLLQHPRFQPSRLMDSHGIGHPTAKPTFYTSSHSNKSGGRGSRGSGGGSSGKDKIDALGRLLTRVLRHKASELKLNMRSDGYVKIQDLLKLNLNTLANIPLRSHTIEDVREAVRQDNKQRFGLLEENGELLIRANQGHSIAAVETERLLKPILSAEQVPGMRRDVNVLIYLDVRKALEDGMKLYVSENRVILTEGFDGVVPANYFQKIESWPQREAIPFSIPKGRTKR